MSYITFKSISIHYTDSAMMPETVKSFSCLLGKFTRENINLLRWNERPRQVTVSAI